MKVETNITLFAGAEPDFAHVVNAGDNPEKDNKDRKTIFAGDFQGNLTLQERIQQRKDQARQEALKIVRDAWAGDQAIDRGMDESREHILQLQEENKQIQEDQREVEQLRQELKERYGVSEDTPLDKQPEEYRERMQELDERQKYNQGILTNNKNDIIVENAVIRETKLAKLKRKPENTMVGAQERAEEVLDAASDDIIGMVVSEAREHLDQEQAEREEKAEKIKEEKEKLEELQEKRDERQEELEELVENAPVEEMVELDQSKEDIQQEVQNIVDKMKLVAEDIKGALVDTSV